MIHLFKRRGGKIAFASILIIAVGMFWLYYSKKSAKPISGAPTIVKLMTVTQKNVSNLFTTIGTVKALQGTNISSTVAGKIATIQFTSGQIVQQGQVLFTLENEDLASTVRQDRAQYAYDQVQYQRYAKLGPLGIVPAATVDLQKSTMQQSKAQLEHDTAVLNKTIITAPFTGALGVVLVSVGQYVTEGQAIVPMADNSSLFVDFYIPERVRDLVKVGNSITAQSKQSHVYSWEGMIAAVDPSMDSDTRNVLVRAQIKAPYDNLVPGMYVDVSTPLSANTPTLVIPQQAVIYNPYGDSVFVYENGKVMQRPVVLDQRINADIVVLSGLTIGEQIVISGQQKLLSGMAVDVAKRS